MFGGAAMKKKLFLYSLGVYGTMLGMAFLSIFSSKIGWLSPKIACFFSFMMVIVGRACYEQLVVYSLPWRSISLAKNILLGVTSAFFIMLIFQYARKPLGYFGIPVAVILGQQISGWFKKKIWQETPGELSCYLSQYLKGLYGFYLILGLGAYALVQYGALSFIVSFALSAFVALLFAQLYEWNLTYKRGVESKVFIASLAIALTMSVMGTFACLGMMIVLPGAASTIIVAVALKSVQTLGLSPLVFQRSCA